MNDFLETLLLVEDEPDHAELVIDALKSVGRLANRLEWVKNGQEALDYMFGEGIYANCGKQFPGLILLDINMPILDGFEVLVWLKSQEGYKTIPVVILTTSSNSEDVKRALQLGANDYIVKPVQWDNFEEKVRGVGRYWIFVSDAKKAH